MIQGGGRMGRETRRELVTFFVGHIRPYVFQNPSEQETETK